MWPTITASKKSKRTFNPIRNIVDNLKPPLNHPKVLVNLALGDPTIHGNLVCPHVLKDAVQDALICDSSNGYLPSTGSSAAKSAIAQYASRTGTGCRPVVEDDVIIASGCSGALELIISALMNEGDNILIPRPGFPLYEVISKSLGGNVKYYNLLPDRNWECDLADMESQIDENTKAILISNPSNPCGSNFSRQHLEDVANLARRNRLPIIADEIYAGCVFDGDFVPMFTVCDDLPVIHVGGLAKLFIVPGWRVGWIVIHDNALGVLSEIRAGLKSLTQIIVGANSLIQAAIPRALLMSAGSNSNGNHSSTSNGARDVASFNSFHGNYMEVLRRNAGLCSSLVADIPQLSIPTSPKGAMYTMVGIDFSQLKDIKDDNEFAQKLLIEQNIIVLPGQCFGSTGFLRLVICCGPEKLTEAFHRLGEFCSRHNSNNTVPFAIASSKRTFHEI